MSSFFKSIRGYFKAEYNGRYFSILLRELAQNEPDSFCRIVISARNESHNIWKELTDGIINGELSADCEYHFHVRKKTKTRRADLAFLRGNDPVALMEV